ncbi:MAG: IS1 family transposase, partial [Candidatus Binataceae bacterium]
MYTLSADQRCQVIAALVEGNSIRSVERMTGIHRDTIVRLMVRIGEGCARMMDREMRNLNCQRLQLDELWAFVGMKQKRAAQLPERGEFGDAYTFVAIDADTKLVPCFHVGRRTWNDTQMFIDDLRQRIVNRPQITTDMFKPYYGTIMQAFGNGVDYAQLHKVFASELNTGRGRYSPPSMVNAEKEELIGSPDSAHISTSFVERQNLSVRMENRRFTRLTNAFSKKLANLKASVALHYAHYNFVRMHRTLRCTPAMAAGVTNRLWTMNELLE